MTDEYRKWPESVRAYKAAPLGEGLTAGVDVGTTSTQAVIMSGGQLAAYASIATGADFAGASERALGLALEAAGLGASALSAVAATGWGAGHVSRARKTINEVECHAKGARFMFGPEIHTVADLGGQTVKAIRLYDWDRVRDVMMGDKCATGMGRGLETLCYLLEVPITDIGRLSLEVETEPEPVSTTCLAFAQTETLGLFGRPEFRCEALTENEVYASHLYAVAWRILGVIGKLQPLDVGEVKCYEKLAFTGGLAKNPGITERIARELGTEPAVSEYDPMLAGAIGAALLA